MTYTINEQQKEAIRVLKFDCKLNTPEIVQSFADQDYPITESQVDSISDIALKNKEYQNNFHFINLGRQS